MYPEQRELFHTPAGAEVSLLIRAGTNDHNTAYSCLDEDEYGLPVGLYGVAWDIGAHIGSVTIGLALDNPDLRIIAVEPVPANCDILWRNVLAAGVEDRVALIRGAVGRHGEMVDVGYNWAGSELATHHAFIGNLSIIEPSATSDRIAYPALSIRDLLEEGIPSFVKIDTEGAEWEFFDSVYTAQLPLVVGEWHPVDGHTVADVAKLFPDHRYVTFTGSQAGPGGFRAVL